MASTALASASSGEYRYAKALSSEGADFAAPALFAAGLGAAAAGFFAACREGHGMSENERFTVCVHGDSPEGEHGP